MIDKNIWHDESGRSIRDVKVLETWIGGKRVWQMQAHSGMNRDRWFARLVRSPLSHVTHWLQNVILGDAGQEL